MSDKEVIDDTKKDIKDEKILQGLSSGSVLSEDFKMSLVRERIFDILTPKISMLPVLVCMKSREAQEKNLFIPGLNGKVCHICLHDVVLSPQAQNAIFRKDLEGLIVCKECFLKSGGNKNDLISLYDKLVQSPAMLDVSTCFYDDREDEKERH